MTASPFDNAVSIDKYSFGDTTSLEISSNIFVKDLWSLVYLILSEKEREIYIGETTNASSRISDHLKNHFRKKLDTLYLITCDRFNKSASLDIESYLIRYLSGDGMFKLQNGNAGLIHHSYFQRTEYYAVFKTVWRLLKEEKVVKHDLHQIDNSNLFKYSPYKSLTTDQSTAVQEILRNLTSGRYRTILVEGAAGTGKTVLASYIMKLLKTEFDELTKIPEDTYRNALLKLIASVKANYPNIVIGLVVPMTSLRQTLKRVFKNVKGLRSEMVMGPSEVLRKRYDILLVDEAHRLRRRSNITNYRRFDECNSILGLGNTGTELDWVIKQSKISILFYDEGQSIKPSDVRKTDFQHLKKKDSTITFQLKSQLRVKGGVDYIQYVDRLFSGELKDGLRFYSADYELMLFDNIEEMVSAIKKKEEEYGLSRLAAGYAWEWKSKKNSDAFDIEINDVALKWNSVSEDWTNSENAINEVGCIHTTQGYDLNYAGIIFGPEIIYNIHQQKIMIDPRYYHDKKGKIGIEDEAELQTYIINIYRTLMFRAIRGTFVYVTNEPLREYFKQSMTSC